MLLVIGGLSGAGKSTLGCYLEKNCAFRWIELDDPQAKTDMVDYFDIRTQWTEFLKGNPAPLSEHYPGNSVLTATSLVIIQAPMYLNCDEVRIRYLWGPKEKCFSRAHQRLPELINQAYWDRNNKEILAYLGSGNCPLEWKIEVFDKTGAPRSGEELALAVAK